MISYILFGTVFIGSAMLICKWVGVYNLFKRLQVTSKQQHADIQVSIKQRIQMYKSLSGVVSNYTTHENITQVNTIKQRGNGMGLISVEAYPELKATTVHENMMGTESITDIEARVREYISKYNSTVNRFNSMLNVFPTSVIASYYRFEELKYFTFEESYDEIEVLK